MLIQRFHICKYGFSGKFKADERGPADLSMFIMCKGLRTVSVVEVDKRAITIPSNDMAVTMVDGPAIFATRDTLEQAETFIAENNDGSAWFVLPVYEVKNETIISENKTVL